MEIKQINVDNFRSIRHAEISFAKIAGKTCSILVGINESGKSNILKAINALNGGITYSSDCNKDAKNESEPISIEYLFSFQEKFFKDKLKEGGMIDEGLSKRIKINSITKRCFIYPGEDVETEFEINTQVEGGMDDYLYRLSDRSIHKATSVNPSPIPLTPENIGGILPDYKILNHSYLNSFLQAKVGGIMYVPKIIFWSASEEYLINNPVDLRQFRDKQELSIPLRNIFQIAGISDIKDRIDLLESDNEARDELSEFLSEKITDYINKVWPEHKVKIEVKIEESLKCRVNVIDKDNHTKRYSMLQRSDGFKQFMSIILNLSAENSNANLKNTVILLDEPEVHLHPSGIKYLRDELLRIAEKNTVILSTHSIYMVDRTALSRHLKIEKISGETILTPIDNNPYKEEVIYEALGTSIFEHIRPNMVLVEGKTDKDIFDAFTELLKGEIDPLDIGVISADSVDKIDTYAKFFNGKLVKGFILVDSDKAGRGQKERLLRMDGYSKNNVFEINDVVNYDFEATLEDLLPKELILESVKEVYGVTLASINEDAPIIEQIKDELKHLKKIGPKDDLNALKGEITQKILLETKSMDLEKLKKKYKPYVSFIKKFHSKIKK